MTVDRYDAEPREVFLPGIQEYSASSKLLFSENIEITGQQLRS